MLIGTAIVAGITGYMVGIASSLGFLPIPFAPRDPVKRGIDNYDDEEESAEEDIDEGILDHAPNWANGVEADKRDGLRSRPAKPEPSPAKAKASPAWENSKEECKLVLVVRTDLGMTKGPILFPSSPTVTNLHPCRQNRRAVLPRHPSLLQALPPARPAVRDPPPLGAPGTG
jgi:PTH2 family peptidyl-tRNA hydrolase